MKKNNIYTVYPDSALLNGLLHVIILSQMSRFTKLFTKFSIWIAQLGNVATKCDVFLTLGAQNSIQNAISAASKSLCKVFFATNDLVCLIHSPTRQTGVVMELS